MAPAGAAAIRATVTWLQVYDEVRHPSLISNVPGKAASAATAGAKHGTEELLEVWVLVVFLRSEPTHTLIYRTAMCTRLVLHRQCTARRDRH
jgi:hypothetical protein